MLTGVSDRPWGVGVRVCKLSQGEDFDLGHTSGSFLGEFISGWAELAWHLEATPRLSTSISSQVAACSWHAEEKCERQWVGGGLLVTSELVMGTWRPLLWYPDSHRCPTGCPAQLPAPALRIVSRDKEEDSTESCGPGLRQVICSSLTFQLTYRLGRKVGLILTASRGMRSVRGDLLDLEWPVSSCSSVGWNCPVMKHNNGIVFITFLIPIFKLFSYSLLSF